MGRMVAGLNRLGRQQANVPESVISKIFTLLFGSLSICSLLAMANVIDITDTPATDTLPIATPSAGTGTPVIRQATPSTADTGPKNKKKKKRGKS